jgi:hypothetical protein
MRFFGIDLTRFSVRPDKYSCCGDRSDSPPYHRGEPLPPEPPLNLRVLGGLNRGDNAKREIFLEIFGWGGEGSQKVKKILQKFSEIGRKGELTEKIRQKFLEFGGQY